MKLILVDDEAMALEVLEKIVNKFKGLEIVGSFTNPYLALEAIKEKEVDTVFLDIEMGSCNGIEIAQSYINENPNLDIVFVTAYSQYAVDAFEVNAIDYLLKPIQERRLEKTIKRLKEARGEKEETSGASKHLEIKSFGKFQLMDHRKRSMAWRTQKTKELFALLWIEYEKPVSKYVIMETIFPDRDPEKASTILHTTIYQLRKGLKNLGYPKGIIYKNENYYLSLPIISDKQDIEDIIKKDMINQEDRRRISKIYRGDFLEEESYPWIINSQQNYRESIFNKLEIYVKEKLRKDLLDDDLKEAIDTLLTIDPFRECAARHMIDYYGKKNMQASLKNFYEDYREKLWIEMKLRPMVETIDSYRKYM